MIIENCQSSKLELRFASFHCLGQLALDLRHKFQEYYGESVISHLIVGCKEEHLKLRAHASQAMKNFLSGAIYSQIANFAPSLIQTFLNNLCIDNYRLKILQLESLNLIAGLCKSLIKPML